jgi:signal peptidase I
VPEEAFIGKPFLIHQPLRLSRVSVGGRERTFQSLDWSRLRWLH